MQILESKETNNQPLNMAGTLHLASKLYNDSLSITKYVIQELLDNSWLECRENKSTRQLFFSIIVSIGDITDRNHNLFNKRGMDVVSIGGLALRKIFLYCLEWMHTHTRYYFYRLLPLMGEYCNLGVNTVFYKIWTDRQTGTIKEVHHISVDIDRITSYIAHCLKNCSNTDELDLWAKWLWHIPSTRRKRTIIDNDGNKHSRLAEKQAETKRKDRFHLACIRSLSKKMNWQVKKYKDNLRFVGYEKFRSNHMELTEATMFSTQLIKGLCRDSLFFWFDTLSSGSLYNVQRRLCDDNKGILTPKTKWFNKDGINIGIIYLDWLLGSKNAPKHTRTALTFARTEDLLDYYMKSNRYLPVHGLVN